MDLSREDYVVLQWQEFMEHNEILDQPELILDKIRLAFLTGWDCCARRCQGAVNLYNHPASGAKDLKKFDNEKKQEIPEEEEQKQTKEEKDKCDSTCQ